MRLTKTEDLIGAIVKMKIEKGLSTKTIIDWLKETQGYKQAYCYSLLKEARDRIQEIWRQDIEAHVEISKGQLEELYEDALHRKDYKMALAVRQELNRLMGLYNDKVQINGELAIKQIEIIVKGSEDTNRNE